jgi:alpha-aminoadipate/glutamate carrier protein LysW
MATCPECDAEVDVDEFDVEKGDPISCQDCGSNLVVASVAPIELELSDEDDEDDDDDEVAEIGEDDDVDEDEDSEEEEDLDE